MNEAQQIVFSDPEAAIGSPEAARVVIQLVKRSKQALRRAVIRAAALVAQFGRYLDTKWSEAGDIEKRVIEMNERRRNDPYRSIGVRGLL